MKNLIFVTSVLAFAVCVVGCDEDDKDSNKEELPDATETIEAYCELMDECSIYELNVCVEQETLLYQITEAIPDCYQLSLDLDGCLSDLSCDEYREWQIRYDTGYPCESEDLDLDACLAKHEAK